MQPLLARLKEGPFFTLIAGVTSVLGVFAIGTIRSKGMKWRLHQKALEEERTDDGLPLERMVPTK